LTTLGSYTQPARDFVYQDISGLREELPSYTKVIARGLTDVGAFFNTGLQKIKNYIDTGTGDQPIIDVAEPTD